MRNLLFLGLIGFCGLILSVANYAPNDGAFDAQVNTMKQECKDMISTCRYEGSKITYYVAGSGKQTKNVELFLFLAKEYQIAISAKKSSAVITAKFYDAAPEVKERKLIKEYKSIQGKSFMVSSDELNKLYRKKAPEVERLKNIHVEYSIGTGKNVKEAAVLVYGFKA